jgi:TonB family protein
MDFGLARIEASTLTAAGEIIGSAAYMAPELITEQPADGRSDLFSLGVVVYELLTGNRPFAGGSISAIIARIVNDSPPPPTQLELALPPSYDAILARALAKAPANRYPTAAEFAQALRASAEEAAKVPRRDEGETSAQADVEAGAPAAAERPTSRTHTLVPTQAPPPLPDPADAPATAETMITSALPETVMAPAPPASAAHPADATVIDVLEELSGLVPAPAATSFEATRLDAPPSVPPAPAAAAGAGVPPIPADGKTSVATGTVIMDAAPAGTVIMEAAPPAGTVIMDTPPPVPGSAASAASAAPSAVAAPAAPPKKSIPWVPIALTGGFLLVVLLAGGFFAIRWLLGYLERGAPTATMPSGAPEAAEATPPIEAVEEPIQPVDEPSIVPEGGATTLATTAPLRGTLVVSSVPSGARVTVGRRARGSTPLRVELPPGRVSVGVHKEGYRPWTQEVSLPAGESVRLQAQLEAIPPPAAETPPPAAPTPPPLKRGDLVALTPDVKPPRRTGGDSPGMPRSGPRPRLPASVLLEFVVTEDGGVRDIRVVESGGDVLDRACSEAVARWRYEAAVKDGIEVSVTQRARFTFQSR